MDVIPIEFEAYFCDRPTEADLAMYQGKNTAAIDSIMPFSVEV